MHLKFFSSNYNDVDKVMRALLEHFNVDIGTLHIYSRICDTNTGDEFVIFNKYSLKPLDSIWSWDIIDEESLKFDDLAILTVQEYEEVLVERSETFVRYNEMGEKLFNELDDCDEVYDELLGKDIKENR